MQIGANILGTHLRCARMRDIVIEAVLERDTHTHTPIDTNHGTRDGASKVGRPPHLPFPQPLAIYIYYIWYLSKQSGSI